MTSTNFSPPPPQLFFFILQVPHTDSLLTMQWERQWFLCIAEWVHMSEGTISTSSEASIKPGLRAKQSQETLLNFLWGKPFCQKGCSNWNTAFPSQISLGITSPSLPTNKTLIFSKGSPSRVLTLKNKCQQVSDIQCGQFYWYAIFSRKCLHILVAA